VNAIGRLFSVIAALAVGVGAFLPWAEGVRGGSVNSVDISAPWAFGFGGARLTDTFLQALVFPLMLAAVLLLVAGISGSSALSVIGGVVSGACVIAWVVQESSSTLGGSSIVDAFATGAIAVTAGAVLALLAAAFRMPRADAVVAP
jgi:hypothetical protein